MKEYLRAVGYAMITIVAVLFGMGLVEFGYLTAAVYFGLTMGQTEAAILGISLVAGAVKTARERRRQRSRCEAMEKAIQLISTTDLTFTEIAEKIGFTTSRYFSTSFKQYTGETPTQYKEK